MPEPKKGDKVLLLAEIVSVYEDNSVHSKIEVLIKEQEGTYKMDQRAILSYQRFVFANGDRIYVKSGAHQGTLGNIRAMHDDKAWVATNSSGDLIISLKDLERM